MENSATEVTFYYKISFFHHCYQNHRLVSASPQLLAVIVEAICSMTCQHFQEALMGMLVFVLLLFSQAVIK